MKVQRSLGGFRIGIWKLERGRITTLDALYMGVVIVPVAVVAVLKVGDGGGVAAFISKG